MIWGGGGGGEDIISFEHPEEQRGKIYDISGDRSTSGQKGLSRAFLISTNQIHKIRATKKKIYGAGASHHQSPPKGFLKSSTVFFFSWWVCFKAFLNRVAVARAPKFFPRISAFLIVFHQEFKAFIINGPSESSTGVRFPHCFASKIQSFYQSGFLGRPRVSAFLIAFHQKFKAFIKGLSESSTAVRFLHAFHQKFKALSK